MDELYLENIDEYIQDENRIVTYKWLSLTLNVASNSAKQMLYHYFSQNNSNKNLHATYLISGVYHDSNIKQDIYKVCVVRDSELEKMKKKFKSIFSIHIYSLQKSTLCDLNFLYTSDYDKVKENVCKATENSGIICPYVQIRSSESNSKNIKPEFLNKLPSPMKSVSSTKTTTNATKFIENKTEDKENKSGECNLKNNKKNISNVKKSSIASLFTKQAEKWAEQKLDKKSDKLKTNTKKEVKVSPLANFLTRIPSNNLLKHEILHEEKIKDENKEEVKTLPENVTKIPENISPEKEIKHNNKGLKIKSSNKNKKRKSIQQSSAANSKRMRIVAMDSTAANSKRMRIVAMDSSSESSDEGENEILMDECPIPEPPVNNIQSDDEDVIPSTPQRESIDVVKMAKGKKRKLVDKTFVDEDGFLVTKKEVEFVSDCSDEENPIPNEKVVTPPKKETKNSPIKTKQTSIMCFFKKK